jgi:TolB protein
MWDSPENGAWEDKHGQWRHTAEHWLCDIILLDMETKKTTNLTAVERVSFYNAGLRWWPENKFSFSAMINGQLRPYQMDRDGKNKKPVEAGPGFIYAVVPSPDGKRVCYHRDYRLSLADGDGKNAQPVKDDNPFHFIPLWSPTGEWVAYLSGEHYNCHPHLVRSDGTGLRKLGDRGGYRGTMQPIDKGQTGHSERSDTHAWSPDGKWLYYTAKVGAAVELMRASPAGSPSPSTTLPKGARGDRRADDPSPPISLPKGARRGRIEQLTRSKPGVHNYLPQVSLDCKWVVWGSTSTGARQLHVARADGSGAYQLTKVEPGWGAFHPHWRPR